MTEIDIAKKAVQEAETAKKLERAKRELKTQTDMMEKRIRQGQEVGNKAIDVKYKAREVQRLEKELLWKIEEQNREIDYWKYSFRN